MIATADLYAAFLEHTKGASCFTRRMAIDMADFFDTSPRFIVQRLESLWIIKEGSWDWFTVNGGITKAHIHEARSDRQRTT
ncbi:hypothetical protein JET14_13520 [Martelella lutilitoris]|uniref:Uncharacterized protein n=1 Tax=Martelella lutilitoris TaxID=2583532 RepID=A0A7T7KK95_9HYPH|nr:hypothetical protein [Martelella lutilitoris]QQM29343.1 hypothetical protein JET14_13520 [Martelella lutilitoris]